MGYYTELHCKIPLRKDIPEVVLSTLQRVLIKKDLGTGERQIYSHEDVFVPSIEHPFFKCSRWEMLFLGTNFGDLKGGSMCVKNYHWVIELETEFKNYDDEIDNFINWISPFVVGRKKKQYIGYYKGEDRPDRINIYIKRG